MKIAAESGGVGGLVGAGVAGNSGALERDACANGGGARAGSSFSSLTSVFFSSFLFHFVFAFFFQQRDREIVREMVWVDAGRAGMRRRRR
jgi:hypothetical protein